MALTTRSAGFLTLLRKKNFLLLWLAQLISMTVFFASNYALVVMIENLTHSATMVGLAIIFFSLPAVLFGAPAGVFVDKMHKRRVLWGTNMLRALATLVFVLVLLFDRQSLLVPIYLLTFLISAIGQFFIPAEGATIPMLVEEEELMPALSLFNITSMLAQALGFIIIAPIALSFLPEIQLFGLAIDSVAQLYIVVCLLYIVCAGLVALIPAKNFVSQPKPEATSSVTSETIGILGNVWNEMLQGWSFVRRDKQLFLAVIQLSFAGILILVIGQLATPIVTQLLQLPATAMAFIFAPAGVGLVLGSLFMPGISQRLGRPRSIAVGIIALTIIALLLPLLTLLAQSMLPGGWNTNPLLLLAIAVCMFLAGVALDFINIPAQTSMQELSPDWIKGRVLALQLVLYNACSIPVIVSLGAVADIFGVDRVLYLLSACVLTFGIWGGYYQRKHPQPSSPEDVDDASDSRRRDKIGLRSVQSH